MSYPLQPHTTINFCLSVRLGCPFARDHPSRSLAHSLTRSLSLDTASQSLSHSLSLTVSLSQSQKSFQKSSLTASLHLPLDLSSCQSASRPLFLSICPSTSLPVNLPLNLSATDRLAAGSSSFLPPYTDSGQSWCWMGNGKWDGGRQGRLGG